MIWKVLDVPSGLGGSRTGSQFGPRALRAAGLLEVLRRTGHAVIDAGAVEPGPATPLVHPNRAIRALPEIAAWTRATASAAHDLGTGTMFLGGDHSISAGTISGMARRAQAAGRPLFVLWVDAHPDFHTLGTSTSGNLHGVPLAYASGQPGFTPWFPPLVAAADPRRICLLGTRSVDAGERAALEASGVIVHGMAAIRAHGIPALIEPFLASVEAEKGWLHVSFDVDVLDPAVAPAVGTPVPAGTTLAEVRLLMERLRDSGLVTSLDVVELNPTLEACGDTTRLTLDLVATVLGRHAGAREKRIA